MHEMRRSVRRRRRNVSARYERRQKQHNVAIQHHRANDSICIGGAIWHPKCGPGPTENGTIINGLGSGSHIALNGNLTDTDREFDRMSSSAASETQVYQHLVVYDFASFFFFGLCLDMKIYCYCDSKLQHDRNVRLWKH